MRRNNKKSKQCYIFVLLYLVGLGLKHQCHHNIALGYLNFIFKKNILQQKTYGKGINLPTAFPSHYLSLLNHDYIGCLLHLHNDCSASS